MYQVDGFLFTSKDMAKEAKKEADAVRYIREQTDLRNPDIVFKLYRKLLADEVFTTEVGIAFLRELQEHLWLTPYIKREDVPPIPVAVDASLEREVERARAREASREQKRKKDDFAKANGVWKVRFQIASFLAVVLALALTGVFALTYYGGESVTILNYENVIIDRYSSWESELDAREAELREREEEISQREERLQEQTSGTDDEGTY